MIEPVQCQSLALSSYAIFEGEDMNSLFHTTGPVLGQVNDYSFPTLSGLRQIRQDTSADIAELPEVFHRLSHASFERPNANRRDRSSGKKIVSKWKN